MTNYPFDDVLNFNITTSVAFPFYLRVPNWYVFVIITMIGLVVLGVFLYVDVYSYIISGAQRPHTKPLEEKQFRPLLVNTLRLV